MDNDEFFWQTADGTGRIDDLRTFFADIPAFFGWKMWPQSCIHIWTNNSAEFSLAIREFCPDFLGIWNNGFVYPVWQAGGFRTFLSGGIRAIILDLRAFTLDASGPGIWAESTKIEEWMSDVHSECFTAGMLAKGLYTDRFFYTKQMHAAVQDRLYVRYPSEISRAIHRSYHGGRVQAVEIGSFAKPDAGGAVLWHTDINSLYPFLMSKRIPVSFCREERNPKIDLNQRKKYEFALVECCGYILDDCPFGPFPASGPHGTEYPVGDFDGVYTIDELRGARDWIEDLEVFRAWFFKSADLFSGWVQFWYAQKRGGSPVAKIFLNSLYGKFAQHPPQQTRYISATDAWTEFQQSPDLWANRTNPVISTAITARGRMMLWRAMMDWHGRGGRVVYVDTDSIWGYLPPDVRPNDVLRVSQSRLGSWKILDDCKEVLVVYGKKMYITDDEVRHMSGLPMRALRKGGFYEWEMGPGFDSFR